MGFQGFGGGLRVLGFWILGLKVEGCEGLSRVLGFLRLY